MPFDAPFMLGPFVVDPHGRLQPNAPEATPTVHVRWRGMWVAARLAARAPAPGGGGRPTGEQAAEAKAPGELATGELAADAHLTGVLSMSAVLGRVRSTAGAHGHLRAQALGTLRGLVHAMPEGWRIRVLPNHSARVEAAHPLALPATATALLTPLTCFLLDLAPYLDLLAAPDAGFETVTGEPGASATAGMVNT